MVFQIQMFKNNAHESNEKDLILDKSLQTGFKKEREDSDESPESDEELPPEDAIPDLPENKEAREFLKKAPSKGLVIRSFQDTIRPHILNYLSYSVYAFGKGS